MRLIWFAVCLSALLTQTALATELQFDNFAQSIVLRQIAGNIYEDEASGQRYLTAPRIIVRADPTAISTLQTNHAAITNSRPLFQLGEHHVYLLEIDDATSHLQTLLETLANQPGVIWVQPDLLQLNTITNRDPAFRHQHPQPAALRLNWTALRKGNQGHGVRIAIIDDGIDLSHPAMQQVELAFAYDITTHQLSALPHSQVDNHGTKVASALFASAAGDWHQGLAPKAQLIALRQPDTWTANTLLAFQLAQLAGADVINCSWHTSLLLQPVAEAVSTLARSGRNGRGIAVVFAAGNDGQAISSSSNEAAIDDAIVVATDGLHSSYGPSVDVVLPATRIQSAAAEGGVVSFGGTSLAASQVSGALALLLARNPDHSLTQLLQDLRSQQ